MKTMIICFSALILSFATMAQEHYLLIGTYTSGSSKGIYVYKFNSATGEATYVSEVAASNPSFLAVSPNKKFVYAVNEGQNDKGSVSAFAFDAATGTLKLLNIEPTGGDHPCYVNIDKTGKWVTAGNYTGGSVSVLPVKEDGSLGPRVSLVQHKGSSINKERQEKPHVHSTIFSPDYKYLFVPDLGIDKVMTYAFNKDNGQLTPATPPFTTVKPGAGPRHLDFHPSGKFAYLSEEMGGSISAYSYANGKLTFIERVTALPKGYTGSKTVADIHVSPDGRFLYASNRNESNTLIVYAINPQSGKLTFVQDQSALGKIPRNFNFDPSAHYLLVANQESDDIFILKREAATGKLTPTGKKITVPKPVCIKWIE